jgi:hypothetical protein
MMQKKEEYAVLKAQWQVGLCSIVRSYCCFMPTFLLGLEVFTVFFVSLQTVSEEQAKRFAKYRERKHRVEKDVVR